MKRALTIVLATMLLALMIPVGAVSAQGNTERGNSHAGKVTVCHKPSSAHPVTITIAKIAWKAHKAHGDTLGACPGSTPKPRPNPTAPGTCTFDAATSAYYNGPTSASALYATGPIHFSWTVATGLVTVPGGYWNEQSPPPPAAGSVTYQNLITAGSVSGTGAVSLSFARTIPDARSFGFTGTLSGNVLSGKADGDFLLTATGTVTCAAQSTPSACTFDAATSAYYNGPTSASVLYATGPIHFSWTVATGLVTVPGGTWTEFVGSTPYFNLITAGSVSGTGAVSLSFARTNPDVNSFGFTGTLSSNVLSGLMAGNYFTATGRLDCTGSSRHDD